MTIDELVRENHRRNKDTVFDPLTGEGAVLERTRIEIADFPIPVMWIPNTMLDIPLVRQLIEFGSIRKFLDNMECESRKEWIQSGNKEPFDDSLYDYETNRPKVVEQFTRIRIRHDFCFWAFVYVLIKNKLGGEDIHFRLNRPQRRLVERFERMRLAGKPIRLILLKARQWGGSTCTQIYMAWIQLVHMRSWNSLIVGHVKDASVEVKDMFDKMLENYPIELLYEMGEEFNPKDPKIVGVGNTGNIHKIPQRNCKIKIGTAERPNSARGGDSVLVHCTEVAFWTKTEGKTPEDIIRSACSGAGYLPMSLIVYESTANGTGNFFHHEYNSAKNGESAFESLFIPWFEIEMYALPVEDEYEFAKWLYENRSNADEPNEKSESGRYYWKLWEMGATFENIRWYMAKRSEYTCHADMAAEFPSDDVEAFKHTGERVFDDYQVESFRKSCRKPKFVGDVYGRANTGKDCLKALKFSEDHQGVLWVWNLPEKDEEDEYVKDRYLVVVDIGGRSRKADWSVITVFDRYWMMEGGKPVVVAQWRGHIDHDLLAWKSAQIAAFYNNALLVIESNTLETKDQDRDVDGDQSLFILNQIKEVYDNLYARSGTDEDSIVEGKETKYGWHTNVRTKPMIITTLIKMIREHAYIERDERCLDEYRTYEKKENGSYGAISGRHDDMLMTRAIGLHICYFEMPLPKIVKRIRKTAQKRAVSAATI